MSHKRVAVLRGGPSAEYSVSMNTGLAALNALDRTGYASKDIVISRDGAWLDGGRKRDPLKTLEGVDVVFVALHGTYGEDGTLQRFLEHIKIPFTGSRALSSALAMNKVTTKDILRREYSDFKTPKHRTVVRDAITTWEHEILSTHGELGRDVFVKPVADGSSIGATRVRAQDNLEAILKDLFSSHEHLLIEEYVSGIEATVGVLEDFRGESLYVLPVIEIVPPEDADFFDHTVKYNGQTAEIVPGRFAPAVRDELQRIAKRVHQTLGCTQYSRSDFLIRGSDIYFLEVNTLPGLTNESLFPKAAEAVGLPFHELVRHLVETARV